MVKLMTDKKEQSAKLRHLGIQQLTGNLMRRSGQQSKRPFGNKKNQSMTCWLSSWIYIYILCTVSGVQIWCQW